MSQLNPLAFSVLEKFAQVTRSLEQAKDAIVNSPYTQSLLPYTTGIANQETEATYGPNFTTHFSHLQGLDVTARLYLSRWAASMVENPSFSGAFSTNSSRHNISLQENLSTEVGDFEILEDLGVAPYDRFICCSKEPLSAAEWVRYFYQQSDPYTLETPHYSSQLLIPDYLIRKRIFSGGIEHDIRPEVWKYLLNVYPWDSTEDERNEIRTRNNDNYFKLKQIWLDPKIQQTEDYQEQKSRIEKDVLRTDRHIPLFAERQIPNGGPSNEEDSALPHSNEHLEQLKDILMCYHYYQKGLGYVQGMSDLLSPLYMTIQDEVETFYCFAGLMERTKANFARDQKGMHLQLTTLNLLVKLLIPDLYTHLQSIDSDNMFCCYRWLLIQFKREFNFETIMRVWELFWCDYLTRHHHIFLALAILDIHHHIIIEHLQGLDEVLKYINDLSDKIDYTSAFKRSEVLFRQFQWKMNTHPNLTLEELDPDVYSPGFPKFMTYRNEPLFLTQEELNSLKYLLDTPSTSTPTPTDSFIDIQESNSFHE